LCAAGPPLKHCSKFLSASAQIFVRRRLLYAA
jgi:hypothetical protein